MNIYFQNNYQRTFGSFPLTGATVKHAIASAVKIGYRSFDTAQMYQNEADVGAALKETGIARQQLCITTKVHPDNFSPEKFIPSVEASLKALGTDYVDVLLLHWPPVDGNIIPSVRLLEEAASKGLAKNIGVSNYTCAMMKQATSLVSTPLVTNQVEFHPLLDQSKLLACSVQTEVPLSSYCSVARGEIFAHPLFAQIGAEYGKSAAQVVLRWILQMGVSINTMSTKENNIASNYDVMDFTLSSVDMARISAKTATGYRIVTSDLVPWAPQWD